MLFTLRNPIIWLTSCRREEKNVGPLSESCSQSTPCLLITSVTSNWVMVRAFWLAVGKTSTHLVKTQRHTCYRNWIEQTGSHILLTYRLASPECLLLEIHSCPANMRFYVMYFPCPYEASGGEEYAKHCSTFQRAGCEEVLERVQFALPSFHAYGHTSLCQVCWKCARKVKLYC